MLRMFFLRVPFSLQTLFYLQLHLSYSIPALLYSFWFPGFLELLQPLKGNLPSSLGPELHREVELGMFVFLSGKLEALPPVWCWALVKSSSTGEEVGIFICSKQNLSLNF
jgi:hypothetical protein